MLSIGTYEPALVFWGFQNMWNLRNDGRSEWRQTFETEEKLRIGGKIQRGAEEWRWCAPSTAWETLIFIADHSYPSSSAEFENAQSFTSTPQYVFKAWNFLIKGYIFMERYLVKNRYIFTFTFTFTFTIHI